MGNRRQGAVEEVEAGGGEAIEDERLRAEQRLVKEGVCVSILVRFLRRNVGFGMQMQSLLSDRTMLSRKGDAENDAERVRKVAGGERQTSVALPRPISPHPCASFVSLCFGRTTGAS